MYEYNISQHCVFGTCYTKEVTVYLRSMISLPYKSQPFAPLYSQRRKWLEPHSTGNLSGGKIIIYHANIE